MIDNDCNILSNMSKTDFRECRNLVIEMVLHTGKLTNINSLNNSRPKIVSGIFDTAKNV